MNMNIILSGLEFSALKKAKGVLNQHMVGYQIWSLHSDLGRHDGVLYV